MTKEQDFQDVKEHSSFKNQKSRNFGDRLIISLEDPSPQFTIEFKILRMELKLRSWVVLTSQRNPNCGFVYCPGSVQYLFLPASKWFKATYQLHSTQKALLSPPIVFEVVDTIQGTNM